MKGRLLTKKEEIKYSTQMKSLELQMDRFIFGFKKQWRIENTGIVRLYFGNSDGYTKFGSFIPFN